MNPFRNPAGIQCNLCAGWTRRSYHVECAGQYSHLCFWLEIFTFLLLLECSDFSQKLALFKMLISRLYVSPLSVILTTISMEPSHPDSQSPRANSTVLDSEQSKLNLSSSTSNDSSYETSDADEEMSLSEMKKWKRIFEPSESDLDGASSLPIFILSNS